MAQRLTKKAEQYARRCGMTPKEALGWILSKAEESDNPPSGVLESYSAPMRRVEDYADEYADHWRGRSPWYWMCRLTQEVGEAIGVLLGVHDDNLDHELTQIASICVNWQRKRGAE